MNHPKLKYEGKWTWRPESDQRSWRIMTTYIDVNGHDRRTGSFTLWGLQQIGLVPSERKAA